MITKLGNIMIPVDDCADAVQWYTGVLGFEARVRDTTEESGHHWAMVGPKDHSGPDIILFACRSDFVYEQKPEFRHHECLHQIMLITDHCDEEVQRLKDEGVHIVQGPMASKWGTQAVFRDPYGNEFTLLEQHTALRDSAAQTTESRAPC